MTPEVLPVSLPEEPNRLIGREHELSDLRLALRRTRALTLCGAGGIGKTRLALQLASTAAGKDGAWFVDLAPLTTGERIWEVAASALGVREVAGEPVSDTVLRHLATRDSLIVLDNCEHVVVAAAAAAEALLGRCPRIHVVAVSREPVGVYGELTWRLPSLRHDEAVALFHQRARLAAPLASIGPERTVGDLVDRLDRLPLAIELAAARVSVLTPDEILGRLDDAFSLLTGGARTVAPRHQTLAATVDWSYDLLEGDQRRLFDRLSVFAGGFDLEAADAVGDGPALHLLAALVDRSLVVAEPQGETTRYRLLEVLRQYGRSRLAQSGDLEEVRRRHAAHYLETARRTDQQLRAGGRSRWLPRLRQEQENFQLALEWAASAPGDMGLRLATHLARFWTQDGWAREGSAWIERMLPVGTSDPSLLATALHRAGELAYLQGDYATAWSRLEASLAIKQQMGDEPGMARRLNLLSIIATARGEFETAALLGTRALEIARGLDDARGVGWANLSLGYAALLADDRGAAGTRFHEAMAIHQALDDPLGTVYDLSGLIWLDLEAGSVEGARAKIREGVALLERHQSIQGERGWLLGGMVLAETEGRDRAALRLAGAIHATERRGLHMMEAIRARYEPHVDRARQRVGEREASRLMVEGAAMAVDELVQEVLGDGVRANAARRSQPEG
jgi:predicted ATPase